MYLEDDDYVPEVGQEVDIIDYPHAAHQRNINVLKLPSDIPVPVENDSVMEDTEECDAKEVNYEIIECIEVSGHEEIIESEVIELTNDAILEDGDVIEYFEEDISENLLEKQTNGVEDSQDQNCSKKRIRNILDLLCEYCGKEFSDKRRLREHIFLHTDEKPNLCLLCGKQFRTITSYYLHMEIHNKRKTYTCSECKKTYRSVRALRVHERFHSNVGKYPCTMCERIFFTNAARRNHTMTHTNERPFKCEKCPKAFRKKSVLKQHQLINANVKECLQLWCEICGSRYRAPSGLIKHMLLHNVFPPKK